MKDLCEWWADWRRTRSVETSHHATGSFGWDKVDGDMSWHSASKSNLVCTSVKRSEANCRIHIARHLESLVRFKTRHRIAVNIQTSVAAIDKSNMRVVRARIVPAKVTRLVVLGEARQIRCRHGGVDSQSSRSMAAVKDHFDIGGSTLAAIVIRLALVIGIGLAAIAVRNLLLNAGTGRSGSISRCTCRRFGTSECRSIGSRSRFGSIGWKGRVVL